MNEVPREQSDHIIVSLPRTHLYAAVGLVIGFAFGAGLTTLFLRPDTVGGIAARTAPTSAQAAEAVPSTVPAVDTLPRLISTEGRPSWGPPNARVTIVEFTDYQCPYCRQHYATTLKPLRQLFGDSVRYVIRNFPIASLHPDAEGAAVAAECAFAQGKFWEYHDRLFESAVLDSTVLRRIARDVGLDGRRFEECLRSPEPMARVQRDLADGIAAGVKGTPGFFINGRMMEGAVPFAVFGVAIEKALARSKQ
jgi:protein-disulfide isomerase